MPLTAAFWNVENLFPVGAVARGPQSPDELAAKRGRLADVLNRMNDGSPPDVIGLAEVADEQQFAALAELLSQDYLSHWVPAAMADQTGLGVLASQERFALLEVVEVQRPTMLARPRCVLLRCELHTEVRPVFLAINHWKSRMVHGNVAHVHADRMETARWLGERLAGLDRGTCVIVLGDFNAEPPEPPFSEVALRAQRNFSSVLWSQATPAYLYNTAWRMYAEPDYWEDLLAADGHVSRPRTSHAGATAVLFDQLLVSGGALRSGPLLLRERSVRYHVNGTTATRKQSGNLVPMRWNYESPAQFSGASDHFAIVAEFALAEEL